MCVMCLNIMGTKPQGYEGTVMSIVAPIFGLIMPIPMSMYSRNLCACKHIRLFNQVCNYAYSYDTLDPVCMHTRLFGEHKVIMLIPYRACTLDYLRIPRIVI